MALKRGSNSEATHGEAESRSPMAVRAEQKLEAALRATDEYLTDLVAKVGEPSAEQTARADAITKRILTRR